MNWDRKDIINICKVVAFGIILYWALQNLQMIGNAFNVIKGILSPFIAGAGIAFIVNIPMSLIERKKFKLEEVEIKGKKIKIIKLVNKDFEKMKVSKPKRLLTSLISLVIIIVLIVGIIVLVIPQLAQVIGRLINYIPQIAQDSGNLINKLIVEHPEIENVLNNIKANLENFSTNAISELTIFGKNILSSSFIVITSSISFIVNLVIAIIFAIYILMSKEKILFESKRIIYAYCKEKVANWITKIYRLSKDAFYNYITGQFTECIILGSLCGIGLGILQIPYAATIGAIVGLTACIPIVGALIGAIIGFILILSVSTTKAIIFLVFFVILQQIENNLIYPKVVGTSVGVPGVMVLIAVAIGAGLGGGIGMIISLPITSVLYTLLKESTKSRLKKKGLENLNKDI